MKTRLSAAWMAALCLLALTSCGGGGNPSPQPLAIDAAIQPPNGTVGTPYAGFTFTASGGALPLTWSASDVPPGIMLSGGGTLSGTPTGSGTFLFSIMVQDKNGQSATPQQFTIQIAQAGPASGFKQTGSMASARVFHTAVLLANGKVLVAGGLDSNDGALASAEMFDAATGMFTTTASMAAARSQHTATLLADGRVLITGGFGATGGSVTSAEIFDPATGLFASTGNMNTARAEHTATLLEGGKVLIAGGVDANDAVLTTAELFDPSTGSFKFTASMGSPRALQTATLLHVSGAAADGKVLLTGGLDGNQNALASAELFDPVAESFAPTGSMAEARDMHTAVQLNDGRVLVTGGENVLSAELFDASMGTFTAAGSMNDERAGHTATKLNDGTVLITGGASFHIAAVCGNNCVTSVPISTGTTESYDPVSSKFVLSGDMTASRLRHTATLLNNGAVLIVGGRQSLVLGRKLITTTWATAELSQ